MLRRVGIGFIVGVLVILISVLFWGTMSSLGLLTLLLLCAVAAGFLSARAEKSATKGAGARCGAAAGLITGIIVTIAGLTAYFAPYIYEPEKTSGWFYALSIMPAIIGVFLGVGLGLTGGAIGGFVETILPAKVSPNSGN